MIIRLWVIRILCLHSSRCCMIRAGQVIWVNNIVLNSETRNLKFCLHNSEILPFSCVCVCVCVCVCTYIYIYIYIYIQTQWRNCARFRKIRVSVPLLTEPSTFSYSDPCEIQTTFHIPRFILLSSFHLCLHIPSVLFLQIMQQRHRFYISSLYLPLSVCLFLSLTLSLCLSHATCPHLLSSISTCSSL